VQEYTWAEKQVIAPWDTCGKATVGDFISVVYGDAAGKQGFVRAITEDSEFIIDETSRIPDQPLKIYDSQQIDGGVQVSI
jgi:ribosomal protein L24